MRYRQGFLTTLFSIGLVAGIAQVQPTPLSLKPDPTDPQELEIRQARGRLFLLPSATPRLEDTPPGPPPTIQIVDFPSRPELPVTLSDTIVIGEVSPPPSPTSPPIGRGSTSSTPCVSAILSRARPPSAPKSPFSRVGGAATLPNGCVLRFEMHGIGPPLVTKQRYALFLKYVQAAECFRIVKAWGLPNGAAEALEGDDRARAQQGRSRYQGMPEQAFIAAISNLIGVPP